jgi:Fe-S cluster assembly protein SufB
VLIASGSFLAVQVFNELPLEFAAEVNELMSLKLEGTVG